MSFRVISILLALVLLPSRVLSGVFDNVQPGHWYEIPNSKLSSYTSVYPPSPAPLGEPSNIMVAWGGGLFDSTRNRLIIHGGGHADYAGNEIYAFSLSTLQWSRIKDPTPNSQIISESDTYADGNPTSVHSYDSLLYIAPIDRYWRGGGSRWGGSGGRTSLAWYFNPSTSSWTSLGSNNALGVSGCSEYDPVTNTIFAVKDNSASGKYSVGSSTWSSWGDLSGIAQGEEQTCAIDFDTRQFVMVGNGGLISMHLDTGATSSRSTSGDRTAQNGRGPGLQWHPGLRKLVGWFGGSNLYTLNTSTWSWSVVSPSSGNPVTPPVSSNTRILGGFPFSKFQYVPSEDVFILVNTVSSSVYVYRMSGSTPPPPTDTTPPTVSVTSPVSGSTLTGTVSVSASASDNVGVAGVQFKLDGVNLGSEDTTAPFSVSWNTTTTSNGSHVVTAIARDTSNNSTTSGAISVSVNNSSGGGGGITLTPRTWSPIPAPSSDQGPYAKPLEGKHSRMLFDSTRGRLVVAGGDYYGTFAQGDGSTEVWSIDLAQGSSWTKLRSWCVPSGIIPAKPDNVGWVYDSTRDKGVMLPGFYFGTQGGGAPVTGCNGATETNNSVLFNFTTSLWETTPYAPPVDGYGGDAGSSYAVYDPTTDTVFRFRWTGNWGNTMEMLHLATNSWERVNLGSGDDPIRNTHAAGHQSAIDVQGRAIYTVSRELRSLLKYSINSKSVVETIPLPSQWTDIDGSDMEIYMTFDSINRVILYPNTHNYDGAVYGLGIYNVDTKQWTWESVPSSVSGNVVGFDAKNNAMLFMGRSNTDQFWLYRYADSTTPPPTDTTPPSVSVNYPTEGLVVSGTITLSASAIDNVGVVGVQFKLDGQNVGSEDLTSLYECTLNTTAISGGSHTVTATARDLAGNITTSSVINFTVDNSSGSRLPSPVNLRIK